MVDKIYVPLIVFLVILCGGGIVALIGNDIERVEAGKKAINQMRTFVIVSSDEREKVVGVINKNTVISTHTVYMNTENKFRFTSHIKLGTEGDTVVSSYKSLGCYELPF